MAIDAREQPPAGHIVLTSEDYCALPDGDTFSPPLLPGLTIPLSSLWG